MILTKQKVIQIVADFFANYNIDNTEGLAFEKRFVAQKIAFYFKDYNVIDFEKGCQLCNEHFAFAGLDDYRNYELSQEEKRMIVKAYSVSISFQQICERYEPNGIYNGKEAMEIDRFLYITAAIKEGKVLDGIPLNIAVAEWVDCREFKSELRKFKIKKALSDLIM